MTVRPRRRFSIALLAAVAVAAALVGAASPVGAVFTSDVTVGEQEVKAAIIEPLAGGTASRTSEGATAVSWATPQFAEEADYAITRSVDGLRAAIEPQIGSAGASTGFTDDLTVAAPATPFTAADSGYATTCGIADARAYCWGQNDASQLGDGTTVNRRTPVAVTGLAGRAVTEISSGGGHSCVVLDDTDVACWGRNWYGQLGHGDTVDLVTPKIVAALPDGPVSSLSAGGGFTCAVVSGVAYCWGINQFGSIGDGTTVYRHTPTAVAGLAGRQVVVVSAGTTHACALLDDGAIACWGQNDFGQLGDGTTQTRHLPVEVVGASGRTGVTAGATHTCSVGAVGGATCWGHNASGQLGNGTTTSSSVPVPLTGPDGIGFADISAGYFHSCGVLDDDTTACWGRNLSGQVGDGTMMERRTPSRVVGLGANAAVLAPGHEYTCAIDASGTPSCWGANRHGERGDGSTAIMTATPARVSPGAVPAGLCSDGWTLNGDGRCAPGAGIPVSYDIAYSVRGWTPPSTLWLDAAIAPVAHVSSGAWVQPDETLLASVTVTNPHPIVKTYTISAPRYPARGVFIISARGVFESAPWGEEDILATITLAPHQSAVGDVVWRPQSGFPAISGVTMTLTDEAGQTMPIVISTR